MLEINDIKYSATKDQQKVRYIMLVFYVVFCFTVATITWLTVMESLCHK